MLVALVSIILLAPWPINVWLVALSACPSWYRDYRRGLLASDIGQPSVEITEGLQEVLVPGDRLYALCEYVWITRSKHSSDLFGDALIDITPTRNGRSDPELRRISVDKSGPADPAS